MLTKEYLDSLRPEIPEVDMPKEVQKVNDWINHKVRLEAKKGATHAYIPIRSAVNHSHAFADRDAVYYTENKLVEELSKAVATEDNIAQLFGEGVTWRLDHPEGVIGARLIVEW